jgi:hypothetical protein
MAENTAPKQRGKPFKPGKSGNPGKLSLSTGKSRLPRSFKGLLKKKSPKLRERRPLPPSAQRRRSLR